MTFDDGHGSKHPVEVMEGGSIVIDIDEPTSEGEVFLGWTDREGTTFQNGDTLTPTSDITLVAQWRDLVVHTVTFFDGRANHAVEKITEGLAATHVPGRMEFHRSADRQLTVVVDYAHNGFAFESLLSSVAGTFTGAKTIAVFGAVGHKAPERRHELPRVAAR